MFNFSENCLLFLLQAFYKKYIGIQLTTLFVLQTLVYAYLFIKFICHSSCHHTTLGLSLVTHIDKLKRLPVRAIQNQLYSIYLPFSMVIVVTTSLAESYFQGVQHARKKNMWRDRQCAMRCHDLCVESDITTQVLNCVLCPMTSRYTYCHFDTISVFYGYIKPTSRSWGFCWKIAVCRDWAINNKNCLN